MIPHQHVSIEIGENKGNIGCDRNYMNLSVATQCRRVPPLQSEKLFDNHIECCSQKLT